MDPPSCIPAQGSSLTTTSMSGIILRAMRASMPCPHERRHGNDDPVHRRKQGWLYTTAGAFWTWHVLGRLRRYQRCGLLRARLGISSPMADFYHSIPFADLYPNYTVLIAKGGNRANCHVHPRSELVDCVSLYQGNRSAMQISSYAPGCVTDSTSLRT